MIAVDGKSIKIVIDNNWYWQEDITINLNPNYHSHQCLRSPYPTHTFSVRRNGLIWTRSAIQCNLITQICISEFYVLPTVHPVTTMGKRPTWCIIELYKMFVIIILYMIRATLCSSSGGRQPPHRTVTYREYYTRCCFNTIRPPDDEHSVARNT